MKKFLILLTMYLCNSQASDFRMDLDQQVIVGMPGLLELENKDYLECIKQEGFINLPLAATHFSVNLLPSQSTVGDFYAEIATSYPRKPGTLYLNCESIGGSGYLSLASCKNYPLKVLFKKHKRLNPNNDFADFCHFFTFVRGKFKLEVQRPLKID